MRHKCGSCHGSGLIKHEHGGAVECVECQDCWGRGSIEWNRGYVGAWILVVIALIIFAIVSS